MQATSAMIIPTLADWQSEPWCLDARQAFGHFHGKTLEEAVHLFEEHAIHYAEDLMFMPTRAFGYYLGAYLQYLGAHASALDALSFFGLVEQKLQFRPTDLEAAWPQIQALLLRLSTDPAIRALDPKVCARFPKRVARISERATKILGAPTFQ